MKIYTSYFFNKLIQSYWFIPSLMMILAIGVSFISLSLDKSLEIKEFNLNSIWQGGAQGARDLLSTIAGSIITITGVVFSITTVSLVLASNQYGSKLLPSFINDLSTQVVLGTFLSSSVYTLLILRSVRGEGIEDNIDTFIPNISVTISVALAIISLSMLIFFIHHLSVKIQSTDIIARVAKSLIDIIEESFQTGLSKDEIYDDECKYDIPILSLKLGYIQIIDYKKLHAISKKNHFKIEIPVRAGHFIRKDSLLAKINQPISENLKKAVANCFIIEKERSSTQDIEYAIEQLVAIATRSLSFNLNDAFTANCCIDHLGAALCLISKKVLKPIYYEKCSSIKLVCKQETFEGLVDACFNQIRQQGSKNPSVLIRLVETLTSVLSCTQTQNQMNVLKKHVLSIKNHGLNHLEESDYRDLIERTEKFNKKFINLEPKFFS